MCPVNERWCYIVTSSLIDWSHTQNDPCLKYFIDSKYRDIPGHLIPNVDKVAWKHVSHNWPIVEGIQHKSLSAVLALCEGNQLILNQLIPLTNGQYCRALMFSGKSQVANYLSLGMPWCSCVVTVIWQQTPYIDVGYVSWFQNLSYILSYQWPSCLYYVLLDPNLLFLFLGNRSRGKDCHDDCPVDCLAVTGGIDGSWPYWYFLKQCLTVTPDFYFFSCKNRSMV